ncbi:MAG: NAD(P)-binding domain-containing protein [Pseudomonadota bacterium]
MQVLKNLVKCIDDNGFRFNPDTTIFAVQHLMQQSLYLFDALSDLGIKYSNMFVCGKNYSSNADIIEELRNRNINTPLRDKYKIGVSSDADIYFDLRELSKRYNHSNALNFENTVLLDDGGHLLASADTLINKPSAFFCGVEQTGSGIHQYGIKSLKFPTVDVSSSAAKRIFEPPLIAKAVYERLISVLHDLRSPIIGIIGLGYVGQAIAESLLVDGYSIYAFDSRSDINAKSGIRIAKSINEIVNACDVIIGATGKDISKSFVSRDQFILKEKKVFVSVSSGDVEFYKLKSLFFESNAYDPESQYDIGSIPNLEMQYGDGHILLLRNGFPINFDNSLFSVPLKDIQGTICLLLIACVQSYLIRKQTHKTLIYPGRIMVDTSFQSALMKSWGEVLDVDHGISDLYLNRSTYIEQQSQLRTEPKVIRLPWVFKNWKWNF